MVTFDSNKYKVADTVVITLDDADLNVDSSIIEVYTIDSKTGFIGDMGISILDVTFDDKDWSSNNIHQSPLGYFGTHNF